MTNKLSPCLLAAAAIGTLLAPAAMADTTPQTLPFSQNWTNIGLITVNDNWTGVPGIEGFRGDNLTPGTGTDPQTLLAADDPGVLDVNANQTDPNVFNTGGVTEFQIADPVVALTGSGTADAPYVRLYLNTTGQSGITVHYKVRDIESTADDAIQQVALHYRVGASGTFTNVPAAYVADATTGGAATLVTNVCAVLPAAADNQALVQLRVMTTNAVGNDEFVGIDDIQVDTAGCPPTLSINDVALSEGDAGPSTFQFTVSLSAPAAANVTFDIATADNTATTADGDYVGNSLTSQTILAGNSVYTFDVTVNGDTTVEPNETFFVNVSNVSGGGVVVIDGQGLGTITNDDVTLTAIHDIQGPGASSPLVGNVVTTRGIVTGVRSQGFYIQAAEADYDANPLTSEGLYVFTNSAPPAAAAVGNNVQVSATVAEYVPTADPLQPPLTELTTPTVSLLSAGNPLPNPIPLTATFPDPAGTYDQLERIEGMRASVASLTVVAPTQGNLSEANATSTSNGVFFGVVTGVARPFREAGIQAPDPAPSGTIPPIPRFDSNPERIRVDSDGQTGGTAINAATDTTVTGLVGPVDYTFRTYTILPDPTSPPVVGGGMSLTAVTAPTNLEFTVASYNMQRFYNDVDDAGGDTVLTTAAYNNRLNKASLAIRNQLRFPDILGVVEMENLATLQALATKVNGDAVANAQPDPQYVAYLVEGNDIGLIDVGFLVKTAIVTGSTPRVSVTEVVQERAGTLFVNPDASTSLLNDRPPLRLTGAVNHPNGNSFALTVIVNHLRSLNDVDSSDPGSNGWTTLGERVRAKRQKQAEDLADLVQDRQVADPNERIVLVGDFNAFEVNDGFVDSMDVSKGTPVPDDQTVVPGDGIDLVNPDLVYVLETLPAQRYSYTFDGNAQTLDHVLVNANVVSGTSALRAEHARLNADFPEVPWRSDANSPARLSDHDPVVAYFQVAAFPVELESFSIE